MRKIFLLLFVVVISGCTFKYNSNDIDESSVNDISLINLKDGTKCAIYRARGGISCDWSTSK